MEWFEGTRACPEPEAHAMPAIVEYPKIVQEAVDLFGPLFVNRPEREHLAEYLTGLLIAERKTVSGIAREFADPPDQSCLNRWLTGVSWDASKLNDQRLAWLQEDPNARYSEQGTISIDNVLVSHTGELIDDVGCFWDHCDKRFLIAHDYIIAGYAAKGGKSFPLEYRRFIRKQHCQQREIEFKTHNDMICELVDWCIERQIRGTFAFDSWFCCPQTQNHIHEKARAYVGELKSNRHVLYKGGDMTAAALAGEIAAAERQAIDYGDKTQWCFTATVKMPKVGHRVRILILWRERSDAAPVKILVSNRPFWEVKRMQRAYCARWRGSECFHRDGKQHLGMGACQIRNGQGQTRHLYLVFLSHSLLVRHLGERSCEWALSKLTTIGEGCRAVLKESLSRTLDWVIKRLEVDHWKIGRIRATLALP
jgi:hypothetical protein